jgi:hypothetical protein
MQRYNYFLYLQAFWQIFFIKCVFLIWASRFAAFGGSRRAIRSITFAAFRRFGGSASIPLATRHFVAAGMLVFRYAGIRYLRLNTRGTKCRYLILEPRSGDTCYQSGRSPRYQSREAAILTTRAGEARDTRGTKCRYLLPERAKPAIPEREARHYDFLIEQPIAFVKSGLGASFLSSACMALAR